MDLFSSSSYLGWWYVYSFTIFRDIFLSFICFLLLRCFFISLIIIRTLGFTWRYFSRAGRSFLSFSRNLIFLWWFSCLRSLSWYRFFKSGLCIFDYRFWLGCFSLFFQVLLIMFNDLCAADLIQNKDILLIYSLKDILFWRNKCITFLSIAFPIACNNSFVFIGSWPEIILLAFTIKLAPEINSKTQLCSHIDLIIKHDDPMNRKKLTNNIDEFCQEGKLCLFILYIIRI